MSVEESTIMNLYENKLRSHDWFYDYSDDHRVWQQGRDAYQELIRFQQEFDKDYAVWNLYAPEEFKRKEKV